MKNLGIYTFLPWLRQGIANQITQADDGGAGATRATIDVVLRIAGDTLDGGEITQDVTRPVQLYGPGDIVGIDAKAVVKTEPRNWVTNFEANYLPGIDFYDEDFPWRYTPAAPDAAGSRLRPWIALVVLKEDEFTDGVGVAGRPLPYVVVEDPNVFPPADTLWAWAHVHVNRGLIAAEGDVFLGAGENGPALAAFEDTLAEDPDLAYSRLLSPRQLEPNTGYHAFVMPVFETGRLAGLGMDPETAPGATASAWEAAGRPEGTSYPYYYRWYFRTSTVGDFEYLVRLLEPKPMDSRVGRRPMDVQEPGVNLPGIDDPALGGILKLGGALQIPEATLGDEDLADVQKYETWDEPYPHIFQRRLAAFINLTDDYARQAADAANAAATDLPEAIRSNPDPLITAPLYGRWHALTQRLLTDPEGNPLPRDRNWIHELNLDPRFRTAAGFGTKVVQQNQETYMEAAWKQVGEVLKANQQIKWAQLAVQTSWVWYETHLQPLKEAQPDQFFALTAPLDRRVLVDGKTRFFVQKASPVPRAAVASPMRRIARPGSRVAKKLDLASVGGGMAMVSRINAGEIHPAPPKITPPVLTTVDEIADAAEPTGLPDYLFDWLRDAPWLRTLILVIALLILLLLVVFVGPQLGAITPGLGSLAGLALAVALGLLWLFQRTGRVREQQETADAIREDQLTPEAINRLPTVPNFVLTPVGAPFQPAAGGADSPEGVRFKQGLMDAFTLIQASGEVSARPAPVAMDLPAVCTQTFLSIDPAVTIPRRTLIRIHIPERIRRRLSETFVEAMAYPEFDTPMYKPLVDLSAELFLPNIQYVEENSISLLETNQRFIESYMVGLNHEFGRELLWREYPTDQRGSYFRQFWDVSSYLDRSGADAEALKEELRDIPPIHLWSKFSDLGDHDHREKPGENEEELVLVIRGELLKKYPTAVIYAHRAEWVLKTDGTPDKTKPRGLAAITPAEEANPPDSKIRTPLYEAKVDPDIYFFGFDLTAVEAKGESDELPDDPGWFFVIKERPGEPRFGLDVDQDGAPGGTKNTWSDLSWTDVGVLPGEFLQPLPPPAVTLVPPTGTPPPGMDQQHAEDIQIPWNTAISAAEMAYILYQVPVLVAVHASEMLPAT